jgi:hypothetical protein
LKASNVWKSLASKRKRSKSRSLLPHSQFFNRRFGNSEDAMYLYGTPCKFRQRGVFNGAEIDIRKRSLRSGDNSSIQRNGVILEHLNRGLINKPLCSATTVSEGIPVKKATQWGRDRHTTGNLEPGGDESATV